jgi:hypothetical protein
MAPAPKGWLCALAALTTIDMAAAARTEETIRMRERRSSWPTYSRWPLSQARMRMAQPVELVGLPRDGTVSRATMHAKQLTRAVTLPKRGLPDFRNSHPRALFAYTESMDAAPPAFGHLCRRGGPVNTAHGAVTTACRQIATRRACASVSRRI